MLVLRDWDSGWDVGRGGWDGEDADADADAVTDGCVTLAASGK